MKPLVATIAAVVIAIATFGAAPTGTPAAAAPAGPAKAAAVAPPTNAVVRENRIGGHTSWQIPWSGYSLATDTDMAVKAYAGKVSINKGESVGIHVHVASAGSTRWDVYRLGWYQGNGGRRITGGTFNGVSQPACQTQMPNGTVTCPWSQSFAIPTNSTWVSGMYMVVLTRGTKQTYASFVLRDDNRTGALVHVSPSFTYQAYNNFPNNGSTGKSLYAHNSFGATTVGGSTAAVKVSFDRPYANSGASLILAEEAPMIRYAESRGYNITYATNLDLHTRPGLLTGQEGMVSVGHDEYWTKEMFTAAENARNAGIDLAYLGGNNMYWQVRLESSGLGANRIVVCYKSGSLDPVKNDTATILFRSIPRPEQPVIGQMWPTGDGTGLVGAPASWVVRSPSHWLYTGTGLRDGSTIPGLVGIEADRRHSNYPSPALKGGTQLAVLAQSPFKARNGANGVHESTLYQAPSDAYVFSAGTLHYTMGLMGGAISPQQSIRSMTTNLFTRYAGGGVDATVERAAGSDRYLTAVALSQRGFPNSGVPVAYLAAGGNFPDALAAGPATKGEGPVLLAPGTTIPQAVLDEIARLKPSKLVVVGSSAVVSDAVMNQASQAAGVTAVRDSGSDRYTTAAAVSRRAFPSAGVPVAYVAVGDSFPDALSAGTAAAQLGGPVLLTAKNSLPAATKTELERLKPQRIVVVGSSGVVSENVRSQMSSLAPQVVRISGSDRYETSMAIARDLVEAGAVDTVGAATGLNFPDALALGPVVAASGGVLLLVNTALTPAVAEEFVRTDPRVVLIAGSEAVVSNSVRSQIAALYATPIAPAPIAPKSIPNDPAVPDTGPQDEFAPIDPERELPWLEESEAQ